VWDERQFTVLKVDENVAKVRCWFGRDKLFTIESIENENTLSVVEHMVPRLLSQKIRGAFRLPSSAAVSDFSRK
jgi:hypothetical protein